MTLRRHDDDTGDRRYRDDEALSRQPLTISDDALEASREGRSRRGDARKIVPRPYGGYVGSFSDRAEPHR